MTAQGVEKIPWAENTPHREEQEPRAEQPRRSFAQQLKEAFGKLAEAVTGKPTPALVQRRKRRDEGERGFRMYAAPLFRRLHTPLEHATVFLGGILDWLKERYSHPVDEGTPPSLDCMNPYWDAAADDLSAQDFHSYPAAFNDLSPRL